MNGDDWYPNRGIQLYDTYYPTIHYNNDFYDYPYSETSMNSAYGMHLGNQVRLISLRKGDCKMYRDLMT